VETDAAIGAVSGHYLGMTQSSNTYQSILDLRQADSAVMLLVYRGDW